MQMQQNKLKIFFFNSINCLHFGIAFCWNHFWGQFFLSPRPPFSLGIVGPWHLHTTEVTIIVVAGHTNSNNDKDHTQTSKCVPELWIFPDWLQAAVNAVQHVAWNFGW